MLKRKKRGSISKALRDVKNERSNLKTRNLSSSTRPLGRSRGSSKKSVSKLDPRLRPSVLPRMTTLLFRRCSRSLKVEGYMLLEIMITLALSLMVISAVMTVMLNSLMQSRYQNQVFFLQRQFSRVSQLLSHEISSAGYRGCLKVDNSTVLQIQSAANVPADWLSKGYPIKANTMAIHLEKMAAAHDYLLIAHHSQDTQWVISTYQRLKAGDKIIIADCKQAQLAEVLTANLQKNQQIITTTMINQSFAAGSYFGLWQSKTFYIAKTDRTTQQAYPIWGLYSYEEGQTYEWADGVNDLQASMMTDNQHNTVVMVHVLLSSLERVTHRAQTYFFAGQLHHSEEGHLYQAMEIAIPVQPGV